MKKENNKSLDNLVQTEIKTKPVFENPPIIEEKVSPIEATQVPETPLKESSNTFIITSPMVGTFYRASSPENPPYVEVGDKVDENTIVCIVEAMKLFNEIECEKKGVVSKIFPENGELVEFGQPLFEITLD